MIMFRKLSLGLVLVSTSPLMAEAAGDICNGFNIMSEKSSVEAANQRLEISLFNGDLPGMNQFYNKITQISDLCFDSPSYDQICDFNCQLNLARYHLFQSSDIQYMSSSTKSDVLSPANISEQVDDGLKRAKRTIASLNNINSFSDMQGDKDANGKLRQYLSNLARIYETKVHLEMTAGDAWYRTNSKQRLIFMEKGDSGEESLQETNLVKAMKRYENAKWDIVEALLSVPDDPTYESIRFPLVMLAKDLDKRIKSVNNGYLFLGINPNSTSLVNTVRMKDDIDTLMRELKEVETEIDTNLENWLNLSSGQQQQDVDEKRHLQQNQLTRLGYEISRLEHEAQKFETDKKIELNDLEGEADSLLRRQTLAELTYQVSLKQTEIENQVEVIELEGKRADFNLLQESNTNKIADLRWLIDFATATTNLEIQLSQILTELNQSKDRQIELQNEENQLITDQKKNDNSIETLKAKIDSRNQEIKMITEGEKFILENDKDAHIQQICRLEYQIRRLGESVFEGFKDDNGNPACEEIPFRLSGKEYREEVCKLREENYIQQADTAAKALKCLLDDNQLGSLLNVSELISDEIKEKFDSATCDPMFNQSSIVQNIMDTQKKQLEKDLELTRSLLKTTKLNLAESAAFFLRKKGQNKMTMTKLKAIEKKAAFQAKLLQVEKSTSKDTGGITGTLNGVINVVTNSVSTESPAERAYRIAELELQIAQQEIVHDQAWTDYVDNHATKLIQVKKDIAELEAQLGDEGLKTLENQIQVAHLSRSLAEIFQQANAQWGQLKEFAFSTKLETVDCDNQDNEAKSTDAMLRAEHKGLTSQYRNFQRNSKIQDLKIRVLQNEIKEARLEIESLGFQKTNDIKKLNSVKAQMELVLENIAFSTNRENLLKDLKEKIDTVKSDVDSKINDRDELIRGLDELNRKIVDSNLNGLEKSLSVTQSSINNMKKIVQDSTDNVAQIKEINKIILESQNTLLSKVNPLRNQMNDILDSVIADAKSNEKQKIFVATQTEIGDLLKGSQEQINKKRRLVERLNSYLSELKLATIRKLKLIGSRETFSDQGYALVRDQLNEYLIDIKESTQTATINPKVIKIRIPSESAMGQELAASKPVKFEISPYGLGRRSSSGHYVVWSENLLAPNGITGEDLALIDAYISRNGLSDCALNTATIRHLGWGHFLRQDSFSDMYARFTVGPYQFSPTKFYTESGADTEADLWESRNNLWIDDLETVSNGEALPLLGAPAIGTYEVFVAPTDKTTIDDSDDDIESCSYFDAQDFFITLIVADNTNKINTRDGEENR